MNSGLVGLAHAGGNLVVLPGIQEALVLLDLDTGEETRRIENIWEWERQFIGPSVWEYSVGSRLWKDDEEEHARMRELRRISAGPVVVPVGENQPGEERLAYRIFLAIDRSPSKYARGYLVESDIVEIDEFGSPLSLTRLPRSISELRPHPGGVLADAGGGAQGYMTPSASSESGPFFLVGGDAIGHLAWWRETAAPGLNVPKPPGEFSSSSSSTTGKGFQTATGAGRALLYVEEALETWNLRGTLRFPIAIVHLKSGREIRGEVRVPFSGPFPEEPSATQSLTREDGSEMRTLSATVAVRIRSVELGENGLTILIEGPGGATAELRFDL